MTSATTRPHARPAPGGPPKVPLDPQVKASLPGWAMPVSVAAAWLVAGSKFLLFAMVGLVVEALAVGRPVSGVVIAWLVVAAVLTIVLNVTATVIAQWLATHAEQKLRDVLITHLFSLGVPTVGQSTGRVLAMLTDSVERTAHFRAGFLGPIVGNITAPLFTLALIAIFIDPVTAGILFVLLLLVPLTIGGFQKLSRPVGAAFRRSQAKLTASFLESIQALPMLVYATAATTAAEDLSRRGEKHRRTIMRLLLSNQLLIFVVDTSFYLAVVCAAAATAAWRVHTGAIGMWQAATIMLATILIVGPIDVVGMFFYVGIAGRAAQSGLSAFLKKKPVETPASGAATGDTRTGTPGAVVFNDVTVGWPGQPPVVEHFSMTVNPGESVCITGRSGVGKSTLAAAIQCHLYPTAGTITVDGYDTSTTDPGLVRSRLSVIEQRTFLFMGSIRHNLLFAKPDATDDELYAALSLAGLDEEVRAMDGGLDAPVGEHGCLLSGGQAQRLSIARAALRDSDIIIMDEPTSQVDIAGEKAILAALARLCKGKTIIMIAHRPEAIMSADRTITITGSPSRGARPGRGPQGATTGHHGDHEKGR